MSRTLKRWVGECHAYAGGKPLNDCPWNDRKNPKLHLNSDAAQREAIAHAREAGHVGAREVTVERTYTLASERIVE
jgi:hypothetical protein